MCKRCQNIFIGLKKTCLGVLDRGKRDKANATGLKERGGIKMSTTVLSIYAMHALLRLKYLPVAGPESNIPSNFFQISW